ncbi:trypsin-like peptidase domain-containing protein [bacterium SCSIO 12696]|nr:trypsin-like peptidase domain-containing protein [bacterium SCSIO 12696]
MNGIKITVLDGKTLDGDTEYFFAREQDYIVLGRDADICHVIFEDSTVELGVGNEHIGLRRSLGRYQLDLNNAHSVRIDGKEPYEEQEISGSVELLLGLVVRVRVEVLDNRKSELPMVEHRWQPGQVAQRNRKLLKYTLPIVAGLIIAGLLFFRDIGKLEGDLTTVSQSLEGLNQAQTSIPLSTINDVRESVYLVLIQNDSEGERLHGTAWVTDSRQLATNAHVAEKFNSLKPGENMLVRSSVPPYQTHRVTQAVLHPGYRDFHRLWEDYLPVQKGFNALELMRTVSAADVALLNVTDNEELASPLALATADELAGLQAGTPVAFVGFPAEKLLPGTLKQPVPVVQQDEIVRLTDFFMTARDDNNNRLIQHGIPMIGGASGSPLFTRKGKVIGIVSAVNIAMTSRGRVANPADINFAQRVDFLFDLLAGKSELTSQNYLDQWSQSLGGFQKGIDASVFEVAENVKGVFGLSKPFNEVVVKGSFEAINNSSSSLLSSVNTMSFTKAGVHLVTVQSRARRIQLKPVSADSKVIEYTYPIPYGNFLGYRLFITDGPTEVDLKLATRVSADAPEDTVSYQINQTSWQADPVAAKKQFAIHQVKASKGLQGEPQELMTLTGNTGERIDGKQETYVTQEIDLNVAGYYLFITNPVQPGDLNTHLFQGKKSIDKDLRSRREAYVLYRKKESGSEVLKLVTSSKQESLGFSATVYHWPEEK